MKWQHSRMVADERGGARWYRCKDFVESYWFFCPRREVLNGMIWWWLWVADAAVSISRRWIWAALPWTISLVVIICLSLVEQVFDARRRLSSVVCHITAGWMRIDSTFRVWAFCFLRLSNWLGMGNLYLPWGRHGVGMEASITNVSTWGSLAGTGKLQGFNGYYTRFDAREYDKQAVPPRKPLSSNFCMPSLLATH